MTSDRVPIDLVVRRAEAGGDGFECESEGRGHCLKLWGSLPAAWAGHLALHAYAHGLTIVSGQALRTRRGAWAAQLMLTTREPVDRLQLDFLTMARRGPRAVPTLPSPMITISTQPARLAPGSTFARVSGQDTVGFLAEVLRRFDALALKPRRFVLQTQHDRVDDWFWLEPDASTAKAPMLAGAAPPSP